LKLLLAAGANPNELDGDGWAPLFGAVVSGNEESVRVLLRSGANPDLAGSFGWKPLHAAGAGGKLRSVVQLLNATKVEGGIDPASVIPSTMLGGQSGARFPMIPSHLHHPQPPGTTPRRSRSSAARILSRVRLPFTSLSLGDVAINSTVGISSIFEVSFAWAFSVCAFFRLSARVPTAPATIAGPGVVAPDAAVRSAVDPATQPLVDSGPVPSDATISTSEIFASSGPSSPAAIFDDSGDALLTLSALAKTLTKMGADPNAVNNLGQTPLHLSAHQGHVQIVRLLLLYGCDPNMQVSCGVNAIPSRSVSIHVWIPDFCSFLFSFFFFTFAGCKGKNPSSSGCTERQLALRPCALVSRRQRCHSRPQGAHADGQGGSARAV
jgi:ankyrin repeat protein